MAYSKHTWANGELITADKMNNIETGLGEKVKYTDSLSYEEIMASTDLTNKVTSASAVNKLGTKVNYALTITNRDLISLLSQVSIGDYARCVKFGNYFSIILPINVSSTITEWTQIVQVPIVAKAETMGLIVKLDGPINNYNICCLLPRNSNKIEITSNLNSGYYSLYLVGALND